MCSMPARRGGWCSGATIADKLAARFWPGPLTLVLPRAKDSPIALLATAGLDTAAVRAPAHPMAQALIRAAGRPIAAPSANRSGAVSPTRAEHVAESLGDRVKLILDGGPCEVGLESTVLDLTTRHADAAAPRRRHARGDRGGDRAGGAERRRAERRRRPQIAGPARQPLRAGAARAAERNERRRRRRPAGLRSAAARRRAPAAQSQPGGDLTEAAANLFAHLRALDRPANRAHRRHAYSANRIGPCDQRPAAPRGRG